MVAHTSQRLLLRAIRVGSPDSRGFLSDDAQAPADGQPRRAYGVFDGRHVTADEGYEREWTDPVEPGNTRIRYGLTTEGGVPVRFLVQLEYFVRGEGERGEDGWQSGEWRSVARFDHDASGPPYRNVELVGLHLDVLMPDGMQLAKRRDFPHVPLGQAMRYADDYLRRHHDFLVRRFEGWL